jgi:hypothetical protein
MPQTSEIAFSPAHRAAFIAPHEKGENEIAQQG